MKLNAILWDMDGTLINSEPAHEAAFHAAVKALGLDIPHGTHDALLGSSIIEVHQKIVDLTGAELTLQDWQAVKWQHYQELADGIQLMQHSRAILDRYTAKGVPMALVSNSTRDEVELNLSATGLTGYFEVTISRNDVTNGKPAPDGYLAAAKALAVPAAECLVVEDSVTGAKAGLAAGMPTLFHPETAGLVADCPEGALLLPPDDNLAEWLKQHLA